MSRDGARHDASHPGLIATTGPASGPPALKPTVSRAGRLQCSVCQYRHANCSLTVVVRRLGDAARTVTLSR